MGRRSAFSVAVLSDGEPSPSATRVEAGAAATCAGRRPVRPRAAMRWGRRAIGESVAMFVQSAETVTPLTFPVTTGESPPLPSGELAVGPDDVVANGPTARCGGIRGCSVPRRASRCGWSRWATRPSPSRKGRARTSSKRSPAWSTARSCSASAANRWPAPCRRSPRPGRRTRASASGRTRCCTPRCPAWRRSGPFGFTVTDLATSTATSATFDTDADPPSPPQVASAGNSGESLIVLGWDEAGWRVEAFRPGDLSRRSSSARSACRPGIEHRSGRRRDRGHRHRMEPHPRDHRRLGQPPQRDRSR